MKQCLRCNRQCNITSLFCNECEALLQNQEQPTRGEVARVDKDISNLATSPKVAVSPGKNEGTFSDEDDIAKHITGPNPGVQSSGTSQASIYSIESNRVEKALSRLNDAARRLAAAEPDNQRKPKISRLSPIHDISPDIQRESTPLPSMPEQKLFNIDDDQSDDLGGNLPDLWPWLNDGDSGEIDAESWSNRTDPLISRRFPDGVEAARIEEEDMRRIAAEGLATFALPATHKRSSRLRIAFVSLTVLAILALTIDSILVSIAFLNKKPVQKHITANFTGSPTLTLSATNVIYGQVVVLHIQHFSGSTSVYVTRDMDEPVTLKTSNTTLGSYIHVDMNGNANVSMSIQNNWNSGFHTIEAEDHTTRYTAQTSFRITNAGPTLPPHLIVDTLSIDLGQAAVGANSVHPLSMHNAGSGSVVWSASSNKPWLLVAPNQGTFSDSQAISVAGQRANLKPGDYSGALTITSNVGISATVPVNMTVLPLPPGGAPVLQVTPALLSFVATDGGSSPASLPLSVSNPGTRALHWSLSNPSPTVDGNGNPVALSGINWLSANQTKGTVASNATTMLQLSAQSNNLLPGVYTSTLIFNADKGTVNNPQSVNVSLTVLPRCSFQMSTNALSFTTVLGQGSPATQVISLFASSSCSGTSAWTATSSSPWLSVNPAGGQLQTMTNSTATVAVNTATLQAGSYTGSITLTMARTMNTQSVSVQLTVQPPPPPGAPIISASPLNINFSVIQGQTPPAQIVTIANPGGSTLSWNELASINTPTWLAATPRGGSILSKQTEQIMVKVRTVLPGVGVLSAGLHIGQIALTGLDANGNQVAGSGQIITVNLNVLIPCSMTSPTANALAFTVVQGGNNPAPQVESFSAGGNCAWPVGWKVSSSQPSWLSALPASGSFTVAGQSANLTIAPTSTGLPPGTYTTQITISSSDNGGIAPAGSPQTIPVTLTVTGFTVSGTVNACADSACSTSTPLANATVTLTDGSGVHFTATADASGNYTFTGVALGTGTISATGSNGTTSYTGNASVTVKGDQSSVIVKTFQ